jgi:hypothetical protein
MYLERTEAVIVDVADGWFRCVRQQGTPVNASENASTVQVTPATFSRIAADVLEENLVITRITKAGDGYTLTTQPRFATATQKAGDETRTANGRVE